MRSLCNLPDPGCNFSSFSMPSQASCSNIGSICRSEHPNGQSSSSYGADPLPVQNQQYILLIITIIISQNQCSKLSNIRSNHQGSNNSMKYCQLCIYEYCQLCIYVSHSNIYVLSRPQGWQVQNVSGGQAAISNPGLNTNSDESICYKIICQKANISPPSL